MLVLVNKLELISVKTRVIAIGLCSLGKQLQRCAASFYYVLWSIMEQVDFHVV